MLTPKLERRSVRFNPHSLVIAAVCALGLSACASAPQPVSEPPPASTPTAPVVLELSDLDACHRDVALGLGVFYLCEHLQFGAFISEVFPWSPEDTPQNLETFARSSARSIHGPGGKATTKPETVSLEGQMRAAVAYRATGFEGGPDFDGLYATAPVTGGSRVVACITSSDWSFDRCEDVLRLLAPDRTFKALAARYRSSAPIFAGNALKVPQGCHKTGPRTLTCPDAELAISPVPIDDLVEAERQMVADQHEMFGKLCKAPTLSTFECVLDGAEAVCHSAVCADDRGALRSVVVMARVRGASYAASCRFDPQQHPEALPEVCGQIMVE